MHELSALIDAFAATLTVDALADCLRTEKAADPTKELRALEEEIEQYRRA